MDQEVGPPKYSVRSHDFHRSVNSLHTHLVLDVLPAPLLGDLLGDTLLVHPSVDDGPRDLTWVLSLEEEGLGFGVEESEDLVEDREKRGGRLLVTSDAQGIAVVQVVVGLSVGKFTKIKVSLHVPR